MSYTLHLLCLLVPPLPGCLSPPPRASLCVPVSALMCSARGPCVWFQSGPLASSQPWARCKGASNWFNAHFFPLPLSLCFMKSSCYFQQLCTLFRVTLSLYDPSRSVQYSRYRSETSYPKKIVPSPISAISWLDLDFKLYKKSID